MADGVASSHIYVRALGASAPPRTRRTGWTSPCSAANDRARDARRQMTADRPTYPGPHGWSSWSPSRSWSALLSPVLIHAFDNNPVLNSLILAILLLGIVWNLRQVTRLTPEVDLAGNLPDRARRAWPPCRAPQLLAPMASMLASARTARAATARAASPCRPAPCAACWTASPRRLDESRELSRYMTGLLIFLGLLGTFWGLLKTVSSVSDVIGGMSVGVGRHQRAVRAAQVRPRRSRCAGMGTAFSASMYGLAGALVLGFLDLTAGQAQNRFFNELEEWLAGLTRLSSGVLAEGDGSVPVYVQALLEQTAENMEGLQRILARGEEGRHAGQPGGDGADRADRARCPTRCAPTSS